MNKVTFVLLIVFLGSCDNSKSTRIAINDQSKPRIAQIPSEPEADKTIRRFDTPEFLLECYYKGREDGDLEQIAACFGSDSTSGLFFPKKPGINYKIISKEKIQDSTNSYTTNGTLNPKSVRKYLEYYVIVEDSINHIPGRTKYYYWLGKIDGSWIIVEHSSEVESQMQDAEMEGSENADRMMDSIEKARLSN